MQQLWYNWRQSTATCLQVLRKNTKTTQDTQFSNGDLDSGPHDFRTEVLPIPKP